MSKNALPRKRLPSHSQNAETREFKEPLYYPHSKHMRDNLNLLRAPLARPTHQPLAEYVIESGHGTTTLVAQKGVGHRLSTAALPNASQWKVFSAILSKAKYDGKGTWTARIRSGKSLYDIMRVKREFNNAEAKRIETALLRFMDLKVIYDGTWYDKEAKGHVKGKRIFQIINYVEVKKLETTGQWWINVELNSHFMEEMINGLTTTYHLPTLMHLRSPIAIALFRWLNAAIAYNRKGEYEVTWTRLCQYLGVNQHGRMRINEFRDRIKLALQEINEATALYGFAYLAVPMNHATVKFLRWREEDFDEIGLDFPPT